MISLYPRHPFHAIIIVAIILCTLYLVVPSPFSHYHYEIPITAVGAHAEYVYDTDLPGKLARSEAVYDKFLEERQGLIKKYGPTADRIYMFPPDKKPWPAYTVWDFFLPAYNCPHEVQRIGALGDGGKWVCGLSRLVEKQDCVVYSVGINYESSFEAELLHNTKHCQVWGYDFTVKGFGPEMHPSLLSRTHFFRYGLAGHDRMTDDGASHLYTLRTLMHLNGHSFIDLIKIDIESWEFETLTTLIRECLETDSPLPFGQLELEVHTWNKKFSEFLEWWESLEAAGLRPFWTEPNLVYQNYAVHAELAEFSFLNIRGDNIFIKDPKHHVDSVHEASVVGTDPVNHLD